MAPSRGWDGPVSPLCSRNARPKRPSLDARSGGLIRAIPGITYTSKLGRIIFGRSLRPCRDAILSILRECSPVCPSPSSHKRFCCNC